MIFNNLPPEIIKQLNILKTDDVFQKRFGQDKVLDYLESQQHDKDIEFNQLFITRKKCSYIEGIKFNAITLSLYSYLYCIQSNIIVDVNKINNFDLDIFFYLLQTKDYTYNIKELIQKSSRYVERELKISYNKAIFILNKMFKYELRVMKFFPHNDMTNKDIAYDVEWMTGIISTIKNFTSYTTEQLYDDISIMQIYYYYIQYRKKIGDKSILLRSEQQVLDQMDNRMINLVIERLIQKNIITKEQHQKYFDLMKEKKENE